MSPAPFLLFLLLGTASAAAALTPTAEAKTPPAPQSEASPAAETASEPAPNTEAAPPKSPKSKDAAGEAKPSTEEAEHVPVLTKAPELLGFVDAVYPEAAIPEGIEGEVQLLLTISETGLVTDASVSQSLDPRFDEAALVAGRKLTFSPAEVDGVPASVQIAFLYGFTFKAPEPQATPTLEDGSAADAGAQAPAPEPPVTLRGVVVVRGRRTPVPGAYVVSGDFSAQTDDQGRFELRMPVGGFGVAVKAPGFYPFETNEIVSEGKVTEVSYYLLRKSSSPFETIVRAPKPKKEVSQVVLTRTELQKVPGTFGDPIRVLENLPGMARAPFIGGQLLVRGSNPEDSGVYFDGIPIPLLYHFGGLTSVVNPEFLENIDFQPGGFGAEYGRATGGIVDVESRRLTGKLARGSVKIDLADTSLFYRQPLGKKLALGVAVRRSYVDVVLPLVLKIAGSDGISLAPQYTDYQLKLDWDVTKDHDLSLFVFGSNDTFKIVTAVKDRASGVNFKLRVGFHRLVVLHTWHLTPTLKLITRPWAGVTLRGVGGGEVGQQDGAQIELRITNWEGGLRSHLVWEPAKTLQLRAGLDLYLLQAHAKLSVPVGGDILAFPAPTQPLSDQQEFKVDGGGSGDALWGEALWRPVDVLKIVPSLRIELYDFLGHLNPTIDPRLTLRLQAFSKTAFKGAIGLYHQNPDQFAASEQTGNPLIKPMAARHLVFGVEQQLSELIDVDLQLFHNWRFHRPVSSSAVVIRDGQEVAENYNNEGVGQAYGLELLVRHKLSEHFFGWVAYTLMRARENDHPATEAWRATDFDQTHILTVVGSYHPFPSFEVGARLRLVTGNPYTPVIGSTHNLDTDSWSAISGDPNSARLPTFVQLDLRVEYTATYKNFTVAYFLDLQNATNQKNVEDFNYDYRYRERINFLGLPIFPVLGVKGEF